MAIHTTYTNARAKLAELWDRAAQEREVIIISRRGHPDMALLDASELEGYLETAHILRSPVNARRLLEAIEEIDSGRGEAMDLAALKKEVGLADA